IVVLTHLESTKSPVRVHLTEYGQVEACQLYVGVVGVLELALDDDERIAGAEQCVGKAGFAGAAGEVKAEVWLLIELVASVCQPAHHPALELEAERLGACGAAGVGEVAVGGAESNFPHSRRATRA